MKFTSTSGENVRYVPGMITQKSALLYLLSRAATQQRWLSLAEIAREIRFNEASVGSTLRKLRCAGHVIQRQAFREKGRLVQKYLMES